MQLFLGTSIAYLLYLFFKQPKIAEVTNVVLGQASKHKHQPKQQQHRLHLVTSESRCWVSSAGRDVTALSS